MAAYAPVFLRVNTLRATRPHLRDSPKNAGRPSLLDYPSRVPTLNCLRAFLAVASLASFPVWLPACAAAPPGAFPAVHYEAEPFPPPDPRTVPANPQGPAALRADAGEPKTRASAGP